MATRETSASSRPHRDVPGNDGDQQTLAEAFGRAGTPAMCSSPRLRHPLVGAMDLSFENLVIPGTSGQRLIAYTAEPGLPSEAALRLLGSATAPAAGEHATADSTPPLGSPVVGEPATDKLPSAAVGPTLTR
ncbi:MmyB family transcriptional regulator [Streptomyces acidicola]|uniref:MmyB family transcriptional regulator n=1 Tax=Streptomyces acidicola TaxID=2596892 RepID=UPI00343D3C97